MPFSVKEVWDKCSLIGYQSFMLSLTQTLTEANKNAWRRYSYAYAFVAAVINSVQESCAYVYVCVASENQT